MMGKMKIGDVITKDITVVRDDEDGDSPPLNEVLASLIKAAVDGASQRGQGSWHLVVVTDRLVLEQIPVLPCCARMLSELLAVILVCGSDTSDGSRSSWKHSCSAVTDDLVAECRRLGLGAFCLYLPPGQAPGLAWLPTIPEEMVPFALIAVMNAPQPQKMARERQGL